MTQPLLLVEDSPEDYEATIRGFRKAGLRNPVKWCQTGEDALDYLFRREAWAGASEADRPGVILLDLNLPGTDGRQVLREIKADEGLRAIPVIVLTTSDDPDDIRDCYEAGANTYIQKPVDLDRFLRAIQELKEYWFEIAILPKAEA